MEHDYGISTDDDSENVRQVQKSSSSKNKTGPFHKVKKSKKATFMNKISMHAGTFSAMTYIGISYLLVKLETSIGYKIAALSWT